MNPWHEPATILRACRVLTAVVLVCASSAQGRDSAQGSPDSGPELKSIRVVVAADGQTTVVIEGNGPLPEPFTAVLEAPPRIYLDFKGVRPGLAVAVSGSDSLVRRVRVALHTATPLVSRVVLDLVTASPYRVDASGREQGRLIVLLGATTRSPAVASPRAPPNVADPYVTKISTALGRLEALRPVLASIDRRAAQPAGDLTAAASELDAVAQVLAAIKPPTTRQTTHGLLLRACAVGARAARLRQDSLRTGDAASASNAASAAAGALIMLDRASTDLGRIPDR